MDAAFRDTTSIPCIFATNLDLLSCPGCGVPSKATAAIWYGGRPQAPGWKRNPSAVLVQSMGAGKEDVTEVQREFYEQTRAADNPVVPLAFLPSFIAGLGDMNPVGIVGFVCIGERV